MLTVGMLRRIMQNISDVMAREKDYLIALDQRNGDGDLGISMASGFAAASGYLNQSDETDLGKLMLGAGKAFNEGAPSSLGTILSFMMMGMARVFKGHEEADIGLAAEAVAAGVAKIMERANSKPGEKTILDALDPAAKALAAHARDGAAAAFVAAAKSAKEGSDSTAGMKAVHGRAAYYGDKSLGIVDGGSVVGYLIFETIADSLNVRN